MDMTESSVPPIPNRTSTATMLENARRQNAEAVRAHNVLATEVRAFQKTLADQIAQSTSTHALTNKALSESYARAIADTQAEINSRMPRLNTLKKEVERTAGLVTSLSTTLAKENSIRQQQTQKQPKTDNQRPSTAPAPAASQPSSSTGTPAPADSESVEEVVITAKRRFREFEALDHRVRLSAFAGQEEQVYGPASRVDNVLFPLHATQGLLFPYTPTISQSQDTSWTTSDLEGSNYDILSFQKSSSASISLTAKFTAQNQREGEYMFAAIHFLRTVSKAYFGEKDADQFIEQTEGDAEAQSDAATARKQRIDGRAGLPPPVLILSGYGSLMFNNVRCVVKSHSWAFDENSDMVKVRLPVGEVVWLPPVLQISINLAMQMNTDDLRETFSLDEFRSGKLLMGSRKGWF